MASVTNGVNDRFHGAADHARHDRVLVSRYGAGDAFAGEIAEAEQLVKHCSHCAQLARDINTLRTAAASLPAPRRTRDFRLTDEQAEKLRGSALQRWFRRLAAPGLAPLRPLAGVAVSIGLVLMVVGVALPTPAGDLYMLQRGDQAPLMGSTPDGANAPDASPIAPGAEFEAGMSPAPTKATAADRATVGLLEETAAPDLTRSVLVYSGLLIAVLSLGVLSLLVFARRRGTDRLLR
jgi:hypothetical protein